MQLSDASGAPLEGWIIIGEVVGVHIDEAFLRDGRFDTLAARPGPPAAATATIRGGTEMFEALRPTDGGPMRLVSGTGSEAASLAASGQVESSGRISWSRTSRLSSSFRPGGGTAQRVHATGRRSTPAPA